MTVKQDRIRKLLTQIAPDHSLESLMPVNDGLERPAPESAGEAQDALESLHRGEVLSPSQMSALEAIILPGQRPVIDIKDGRYKRPQAPFQHLNKTRYRDVIEPAIAAIGHVELPNHPRLPYGGTAFVVGEGLMMTNRHVAETFSTGFGRQARFRDDLEVAIDLKRERLDQDQSQMFEVDDVVMIHPYWDMALLRVSGLEHINPLTLSTIDPEDLRGKEVAVVGYPALDPRNDVALQNEVFRRTFNVKRMQPGKIGGRRETGSYRRLVNAMTHDSSTLGGNSGSAVILVRTGDVIALHFAGVYLDANFAVPTSELSNDRVVVDQNLNFDETPRPRTTRWDELWKRSEKTSFPKPIPPDLSVGSRQTISQTTVQPIDAGGITCSIPINLVLQIGKVRMQSGVQPDIAANTSEPDDSHDAPETLVEPLHDADYESRKGYDPNFLGLRLPMPIVQPKTIVAKTIDTGESVLHYHNFSLVMHKQRRFAILTASNVDDRPHKRDPELKPDLKPDLNKKHSRKSLADRFENDRLKWFNDPRLASQHQLPNVFYDLDRQALDKGRLVRCDEVTWGDSYIEIMKANGDTFHVTNCSPQVAGFNRSNRNGIWGKLFIEVLKQTRRDRKQCTLFSGPVLRKTDRYFMRSAGQSKIKIQIPTAFWKIVVVRNDNQLEAYAFLLDHDLSSVDFDNTREFAFDNRWKKHMVSIEELEEMLEIVRFPKTLKNADQFDRM